MMYFQLIFYFFLLALGLVTLLTFFYSWYRPAKSTRRYLLSVLGFLMFMLFCIWLTETDRFHFNDDPVTIFFIFALPPMASLLMSLAGIRGLADRSSAQRGFTLSFLNALGCMGLTYGVAMLFFHPRGSDGGFLIALDVFFGGGIATIIAVVFASKTWKKRFSREKSGIV